MQPSSSHRTTIIEVNASSQLQQQYRKCIDQLGRPPKYQYIVISVMTIFYLLVIFNTMIGPFIYMNPKFQCNGKPETQLQACLHIQECILTNNFTAVYKNKLYCDKQAIRTTIQSIFGFGYMIGKILFPLVSDIVGRKAALLIALSMGIVAMTTQLIGIQYNIQIAMILGQLAAGIFGSGMYTLGIIYICDFCPAKIRQFCLTTCWCVWQTYFLLRGIGQMFFFILYQYLNSWKFYLSCMLYIPAALVFILVLYFQIESPAYAIFVKKDYGSFKKIVKRVQAFNKFSEDEAQQIKMQGKELIQKLKKQGQNKIHLKQALTKIFLDRTNLKTLACLVSINLSYVFFYYGMQGSMESTGFSFGYNMLFLGITQGLCFFFSGIVTRKVKRRVGLVVMICFSSIVGLLFLFQFVGDSKVIQTLLVVFARFGSTYVFSFFLVMESQLLDVQIRSTCFSIIDGTGQLGRIIGPILINAMYNIKVPPIIAFAIIFLSLGVIPIFFLRESFQPLKGQLKNEIIKQQSENIAFQKEKS